MDLQPSVNAQLDRFAGVIVLISSITSLSLAGAARP